MPTHWWMPEPKATWRFGARADVEPVGLGELLRVAVGRADAERHLRPRRERDAADLGRRRS